MLGADVVRPLTDTPPATAISACALKQSSDHSWEAVGARFTEMVLGLSNGERRSDDRHSPSL